MMYNGYVLRKAADYYWLIDSRETDAAYKKPFVMNETGALIFQSLVKGKNDDEIADMLRDGETSIEDIKKDVKEFHQQLSDYTNSLI